MSNSLQPMVYNQKRKPDGLNEFDKSGYKCGSLSVFVEKGSFGLVLGRDLVMMTILSSSSNSIGSLGFFNNFSTSKHKQQSLKTKQ